MSKESVRGEIAKIIATVDHDVDMDEEVADQILDLLKRDRWVKLVKGDKVICETAWDLLSPVVQKGLEVNQQEAGYKKVKDG